MEVLTFAGLPSILFLAPPTPDQLAAYGARAGIGIASMARSRSPQWMHQELPALYALLDSTAAALIHYKICSTLDSSPHVGSIGKAIELGRRRFGEHPVPVVTAAPKLRRYQAFGSLFAAAGERIHRLDRHPVMRRHPVTPMTEADVAFHLSAQTRIPTGCVDIEALEGNRAAELIASASKIWTVDMMSSAHEALVGDLLWERRQASRFVVGSQGVEYALIRHFQETGLLEAADPPGSLGKKDRLAIVSGSVSPTSAEQIAWARDNGFAVIRLNAVDLCREDAQAEMAERSATAAAKDALRAGLPPLICTAEGPDDPILEEVRATAGVDTSRSNDLIGRALGRVLRTLIFDENLTRVAVSGGDTSGRVCETLGIFALEAAAPTIPGASICTAKADGPMDGLEIALKGGQMGSADFFGWIRDGGGARS
ncbi:four-carbon acid sugar kinase family protein [Pikeienuella piscinae]|nr:four-carbon acid sugar kinase family protein [Pikeienuella piscinae]